jgi:hypothetical protein
MSGGLILIINPLSSPLRSLQRLPQAPHAKSKFLAAGQKSVKYSRSMSYYFCVGYYHLQRFFISKSKFLSVKNCENGETGFSELHEQEATLRPIGAKNSTLIAPVQIHPA